MMDDLFDAGFSTIVMTGGDGPASCCASPPISTTPLTTIQPLPRYCEPKVPRPGYGLYYLWLGVA